jgi:protein SCO1
MPSIKNILFMSVPLIFLITPIVSADKKITENNSFSKQSVKLASVTKTESSEKSADKPPARKKRERKSRYGASYFPNIELTNHDGKKVRFYDDLIKDKIVSINFIFTSCQNICPLETARLKEMYNLLGDRVGKDLHMYSITVDPARDSPEVLKAYKEKFGIGDGWQFLTGKKEEIDQLRTKLGLYIKDLDETLPDGQIDHNISLVMGNQKTGQWMKRSPYEDARVLATMFGDWLTNWSNRTAGGGNPDYKQAASLAKTYSDGEFLYRTRCLTCHSLGKGDGVGPDLLGILQRRDREWLARWIMEPNVMIKEKDPIIMEMMKKYNDITMPNLKLSKVDVTNLFEFLEKSDIEMAKAAAK